MIMILNEQGANGRDRFANDLKDARGIKLEYIGAEHGIDRHGHAIVVGHVFRPIWEYPTTPHGIAQLSKDEDVLLTQGTGTWPLWIFVKTDRFDDADRATQKTAYANHQRQALFFPQIFRGDI